MVARLVIVMSVTPLLLGQSPATRAQTRPPVNETLGVNRPEIGILVPRTSTVPLLFEMSRSQVARVLEPLRLQPKFSGPENGVALEQKPPAGTKAPYGSSVAVTLGLMPRLVLNGPAAPVYAGSELPFRVSFVPPLPAGLKPIYEFTWGDGSPVQATRDAMITHRFANAGARVVSVIWTLDDRVKIGSTRAAVDVLSPPNTTQTSIVPLLFGMNRNEVGRMLEPLHLQAKFSGPDNGVAVGQEPAAGTTVKYGSGVAVTLGDLRLVLNGPAAPAYAGSELTFTAAFVPPLPGGVKVGYYFEWGDGSRSEPTASGVVTHRFADAGNRVVSVVGVINGRQFGSRIAVDVTTTSSTATTTTTEPETTTGPGGGTSSNPLVWIGAAAVVLLLVVTFLLAKVLRALNRKPSEPQVQANPPAALNGGMRSIEFEIEHPELIRRMPEVGLRGGIGGEEDGDV